MLTDDERPLVLYGANARRSGREGGSEMSELIAELLVPFSYEYMAKAMWVSALVGGVCAFLSAYLMLKGWSLMGDALAHSIVPGVAGAYILGLPFALGAFFAGILASIGMGFVKQHTRLREDAVIGLVFTSLFALGLLMASIWPTSVSIQTIVLGNILAISDEDVIQVAIISAVSLGVLALKWKDLMVTFFDESHARSIGLNTGFLKGAVLHAAERLHRRRAADRRRLPGHRHGGDAGRDRLSADRSFRPADHHQRRHRRDHELRGRLYQLFSRRRDRRRHRDAAGPAVPCRVLSSRRSTGSWRRAGGRLAAAGARSMIGALEWITVPLSYPFMQRALIVSVMVGAVCAVLSCYLVLKGWSLMGDAISHAVLPGIVIAYVLGLPLAVGAFAAGLSCALLTGYLKEHSRVKEDTVMGIVFSGMFGFGLVIFTKVETDQHLNHILFGNVLGVTVRDLVETAIIAGGTLLVVLLKRRDLLLYCFDPNHARAIGLPVRALHYGLLILLSLTIVGALKAVGIILVIAMLVAPGAIAYLLTDSFERMLLIATARGRPDRARSEPS